MRRIVSFTIALCLSGVICAQAVIVDACSEFADLVYNKRFVDARSLLNRGEAAHCSNRQYRVAMAMLYGSELRFTEALSIVELLISEYGISEELEFLIQRFTNAKELKHAIAPVFIKPYDEVNSSGKEIIAWVQNERPVILTDHASGVHYLPVRSTSEPRLRLADPLLVISPDQMSKLSARLYSMGYIEPGTTCFGPDSVLIVSARRRIPYAGKNKGDYYELLICDRSTFRLSRFPLKLKGGMAFPHYSFKDSTLVFSTDSRSGHNDLDIWWSKWTGKKWLNPVPAPQGVNSRWNEVFPHLKGDTLYFSSDRPDNGFGELDIYGYSFSEGKLWNLGLPINTAYNDHSFLKTTGINGFMVSDRESGSGSSDIYTLEWTHSDDYFRSLSGEFVCEEKLTGKIVVLTTDEGSVLQRSVVGQNGRFALKHIKGLESYQVRIEGQHSDCKTEMRLYDADDKLIKQVKAGPQGNFSFELLLPKDYYMQTLELKDESILALDVIGRVLFKDPEVKGGIRIVLTDSEGNAIATTITGEDGQFTFQSVRPDSEYTIISDGALAVKQIYILNEYGDLIQSIDPNDNDDFVFVRIDASSKVITLTNEWSQKIKVSQVEQFNLGTIMYEYDSAILDESGKRTLDKVVDIIMMNPDVAIELSGHTDCQGSEEYNLRLSERRIIAAIKYLADKGIEPQRISGKGYGESQPLNHCVDGVSCTEEEHALNRRTELRFIDSESR